MTQPRKALVSIESTRLPFIKRSCNGALCTQSVQLYV